MLLTTVSLNEIIYIRMYACMYGCMDVCVCMYVYVYVCMYSRTSIIQTPVCHFNVKGVQINEFVRISELSDKIHYLASKLYTIMFLRITVNQSHGRPIILYMLICFSTHCTII